MDPNMDISKFNRELGDKISKAKILEKHNDLKDAIKIWLEISDMTLNASKASNIDTTYRAMLITKTQQIVDHIKELKLGRPTLKTQDFGMAENISSKPPAQAPIIDKSAKDEPPTNVGIKKTESSKKGNISKLSDIDDSELTNLPKGFKEVEPSKDFKIITPHDPNYVKNLMSKSVDMSIFSQGKGTEIKSDLDSTNKKIQSDDNNDDGNIICFACGFDKNPTNAKACKNCGTKF